MSHQTGIKANDELLKFFGKCKDGRIRAIKIAIENEELTLASYKEVKKTWESDYDLIVPNLVENDVPCYILYRLDTKSSLGYDWLLISWTPDTSTIRLKMLYASTKATLKTEFGSSHIKEELHATDKKEINLNGYRQHKHAFSAPAPLTMREEELQEIRRNEVHTNVNIDTRHQTLGGISCPITEAVNTGLRDMARGSYTYLQFKIVLEEEKIHLVKACNIRTDELPALIPQDNARYHIFLFKHTHEGDYLENFIFIYSMPGYSCSVKERMMYSSCKAPFIETIQNYGIEIAKKIEIDVGSEVTEDFLQEELHPKKILHRPQFAKPKGPPNRGAKRLTRPTE